MAKKLNLVDMYGIGLMLEHLVAEGNITCEERDRVILRIARENDIAKTEERPGITGEKAGGRLHFSN